MMQFPKNVWAETFPNKMNWQWRDTLALVFIPFAMLCKTLWQHLFHNEWITEVSDLSCRFLIFFLICYLYKEMLALHWKKFNQAKLLSWSVVIIGMVVLQACISLTRMLLPASTHAIDTTPSFFEQNGFFTIFFISLSPLFTALIEDIVFRYTLLQKLFIPNTIWRITLVLLNSIVFGLIHWTNFNGNIIATISFMSAGLFLNLIYLWTRNIWHVLLIHFLNNALLSLGSLLLIQAAKLFYS